MSAQSRAVLTVFVVFFIGVVTGALTMNVVEHFWIHPRALSTSPARVPPASWSRVDRDHYIEQFRKELNLTDVQSKQLESILDETMQQYLDLHSFSHHIRDDGIARIRALLDDNQRKKFEEITRKRDAAEQRPAGKK